MISFSKRPEFLLGSFYLNIVWQKNVDNFLKIYLVGKIYQRRFVSQ